LTIKGGNDPPQRASFPRDFAECFSLLTSFAGGRVIGGMQRIIPVRLKKFGPGSEVRLHNCVSYPLPVGFEEGEIVTVVARETGAVTIERDGAHYSLPLTNIDPGCDRCLNGVWLDNWDRRVRKAEARLEMMRVKKELQKATRESMTAKLFQEE
jgi:hypothetical protein